MPEKPLVFISCGQYTKDEIELGNEIEQIIRKETAFEPYFAEQQNTLEGLVANILSALGHTAAFIGIMHHRGSITTPSGGSLIRGSVWVEQELAIASYIQHIQKRQIEVLLYLQRGIRREGIRSQLLLKPIEFDLPADVISDLRTHLVAWKLSLPPSTAPLIPRWSWKLLPGSTGNHHEYEFSLDLYNNSASLIDKWQVDVCFPSTYINNSAYEDIKTSDLDYSSETKRIWPASSLHVLTVPYFVTNANWPELIKTPPKVKIKVVTEKAPPLEEEILMKDIQKF